MKIAIISKTDLKEIFLLKNFAKNVYTVSVLKIKMFN